MTKRHYDEIDISVNYFYLLFLSDIFLQYGRHFDHLEW